MIVERFQSQSEGRVFEAEEGERRLKVGQGRWRVARWSSERELNRQTDRQNEGAERPERGEEGSEIVRC